MHCLFCGGFRRFLQAYDGSVREAARSQAAAVGALTKVRQLCGAGQQDRETFNLVFSQAFSTVVLVIAALRA